MALALQTRHPRLPIALLVLACFGPDWVELSLGLVIGRGTGEVYSHCVPAVLACAALAGALTTLTVGRRAGGYVALGWLLHWPADFLTAHKPLLDPRHLAGLDLYHLPWVDFALETGLVAAGCVLYARAYARSPAQRRWIALLGLALVVLQAMLDFGLAHQSNPAWRPVV